MDEKFDQQLKRELEASGLSWATIDELTDYCQSRLPSPPTEQMRRDWFKDRIRRVIKQNQRDNGLSEWESTLSTGPDGRAVRRYKQLTLFTINDYRQVSEYHADRARYHGRKANSLVRLCMSLHQKVQMELPFPDWGFLDDQDEAAA